MRKRAAKTETTEKSGSRIIKLLRSNATQRIRNAFGIAMKKELRCFLMNKRNNISTSSNTDFFKAQNEMMKIII